MNTFTVGQEVCLRSRYGYRFGYTVTKVTPSGRVTLHKPATPDCREDTCTFNAKGRQLATDGHLFPDNMLRIETDVTAARATVAHGRRLQAAVEAVRLVKATDVEVRYGADTLRRQVAALQAQLDAAKALVDAL